MAMNDEDKKFIKDTIDQALDKKMAKAKKETEYSKKLDKLEYQEQQDEDREALIEKLKERDARGENTLAQKMELLKLSLESSMPPELRDGLKASKETMKSGAKNIGSGVSHLTGRLMATNPLTNMLWQNRDIFKAVGQIGLGGVKMVGGALGGIGSASASMFKAVKNKVSPKKKSNKKAEDKKGIKITTSVDDSGTQTIEIENNEEETSSSKMAANKKSMAEQVDEIHKIVTKDLKTANKSQKTNSSILSKGLAGLGKTLSVISTVVDVLMKNGKLILTGVMLGAVGLLALIGWFKEGKFMEAIKKLLPGSDTRVKNENLQQQIGASIETSIMEQPEYEKWLDTNKQNFTGIKKSATIKAGAREIGGYRNKSTYLTEFKTGKLTPILAPFSGSISNFGSDVYATNGTDTQMYFHFTLRAVMNAGMYDPNNKHLIFENVVQPKVQDGVFVKKSQILGFSNGSFRLTVGGNDGEEAAINSISQYKQTFEEAQQQGFSNATDITKQQLAANNGAGYKSSFKAVAKEARTQHYNIELGKEGKGGAERWWDDVWTSDKEDRKQLQSYVNAYKTKGQNPDVSITQVPDSNEGEKKLKEQNEQLQKQQEEEKRKQQEEQKQQQITDNSPNNITINNPGGASGNMPTPNRLTAAEIMAAGAETAGI